MNLGVLGTNRFGRQVSEEEPGIGTVGKTISSRCAHLEGLPTVDPLESVALGLAMGESCEDKETRHEAEGPGRERVRRLE